MLGGRGCLGARPSSSQNIVKLGRTIRGYDRQVAGKLRLDWSPRADSRLAEEKPILKTGVIRLSHENDSTAVYLFKPVWRASRKELLRHLRPKRSMASLQAGWNPNGDRRGHIQGYRLNPSATGGGLKIGPVPLAIGEGDLLSGPNNSYHRDLGTSVHTRLRDVGPGWQGKGPPRRWSPRLHQGKAKRRSLPKGAV